MSQQRWGPTCGMQLDNHLETGASKNIKDDTQSKAHISQFYPSAPPLLVPSCSFSSSSCCCYCRCGCCGSYCYCFFLSSFRCKFVSWGALFMVLQFLVSPFQCFFQSLFSAMLAVCMNTHEYLLMLLHHYGWSSTGFVCF